MRKRSRLVKSTFLASLFFTFFLIQPVFAANEAVWLVTPEELSQFDHIDLSSLPPEPEPVESVASLGDEDGPDIRIISPDLSSDIQGEVIIHTAFEGSEGRGVNAESLVVKYKLPIGWMDVTERVKNGAQVSPEGIISEPMRLPKGKHRLRLSVADEIGRESLVEIRVKIKST